LHRDDVGSQFGVVAVLGGPRVRICAAERVEYWGMLLLASRVCSHPGFSEAGSISVATYRLSGD